MIHSLARFLSTMLIVAVAMAAQPSNKSTSRPASSSTPNSQTPDKCYDAAGAPVRCVPDFVNAAYGETVSLNSQCDANNRSPVCSEERDRAGRTRRQCMTCDVRHSTVSFTSTVLTDLHNPNPSASTCWLSPRLRRNDENVTLEVALNKKYEVTYVSLQFCAMRPDSVAIFKSADFGRSWTPFQFYTTQCRRLFNRSPRSAARSNNEQEALCTQFAADSSTGTSNRIAFSTLEGRPSAYAVEESPILLDWMTVTNLRVVLLRLRPPSIADPDSESAAALPDLPPFRNRDSDSEDAGSSTGTGAGSGLSADSMVYAIADMAVGGRCKCNGHAAACKQNGRGKLACDCRHNTMGDDCEKCRPLYQDRPWARGVAKNANECKKCDCNNHAKRCQFNKDLYLQSGKESGGVCLKCKHNTAGRNCHYCSEGFYRDWTKPFTHRKACRPCECHPIGAADSLCNQTTGQCNCKDGVAGTACDRCKPGYQQTRSPSSPCVKHNEVRSPAARPPQCGDACTGRRATLTKFCQADFAIQALATAEVSHGEWVKVTLDVLHIMKNVGSSIKRGHVEFWVRRTDLACDCPKFRLQKPYLIISMEITEPSINGLVLDRSSIVVPWKDELLQRVRNFQRDERQGKCDDI